MIARDVALPDTCQLPAPISARVCPTLQHPAIPVIKNQHFEPRSTAGCHFF
jgi:hypothetical protein